MHAHIFKSNEKAQFLSLANFAVEIFKKKMREIKVRRSVKALWSMANKIKFRTQL